MVKPKPKSKKTLRKVVRKTNSKTRNVRKSKHYKPRTQKHQTKRHRRTTKSKSRKIGGDLIGEGSYGCVFRPPLPCEDGIRPTNRVSKLMIKEYAMDEMNENTMIDKLDPRFEFHLESPYVCNLPETSIYDIHNEDGADDCRNLDTILDREHVVMQQQDGGYSLTQYLDLISDEVSQQGATALKLFVAKFHSLVHGIEVMSKQNISHFDIKPDNIVYNPRNKKVRFIDFGIAGKYNDILKRTYNFDTIYPYYPIDIFFAYDDYESIKNSSLKRDLNINILEAVKSYKLDGYIRKFTSNLFLKPNENPYIKTFNKDIMNEYRNLVNKFTEEDFKSGILEKVDIFSLGMVFVELWVSFLDIRFIYMTDEELERFIDVNNYKREKVFIRKFYKLILRMIHPLITNRINVRDLVTEFKNLSGDFNTLIEENKRITSMTEGTASSSGTATGWRNRMNKLFTRKR